MWDHRQVWEAAESLAVISWLCRQAWPDLAGEEECGCKPCSSPGPSKPESQQLLSSCEAAHPACGWVAFWFIWEEQSHASNAGARGCRMRVTEQHRRSLQQTRRLLQPLAQDRASKLGLCFWCSLRLGVVHAAGCDEAPREGLRPAGGAAGPRSHSAGPGAVPARGGRSCGPCPAPPAGAGCGPCPRAAPAPTISGSVPVRARKHSATAPSSPDPAAPPSGRRTAGWCPCTPHAAQSPPAPGPLHPPRALPLPTKGRGLEEKKLWLPPVTPQGQEALQNLSLVEENLTIPPLAPNDPQRANCRIPDAFRSDTLYKVYMYIFFLMWCDNP